MRNNYETRPFIGIYSLSSVFFPLFQLLSGFHFSNASCKQISKIKMVFFNVHGTSITSQSSKTVINFSSIESFVIRQVQLPCACRALNISFLQFITRKSSGGHQALNISDHVLSDILLRVH
jgi:hypothetical protein